MAEHCPESFARAIAAVNAVLAEYESQKGASWVEKSPRHHTEHALEHARIADALLWSGSGRAPGIGEREHLTHLATRALMALEAYERMNGVEG